ncbi:hypothetical protein [Spirulina major]|uniref:hypothetical protein n=1 Tax=Spirulina major TaxID=270636 RepID=UPI001587951C|nr:hypothetical protein [Spirulina major]
MPWLSRGTVFRDRGAIAPSSRTITESSPSWHSAIVQPTTRYWAAFTMPGDF